MSGIHTFLLVSVMLALISPFIVQGSISNEAQFEISHVYPLNIVYVGFQEEIVDTNFIDSIIEKSRVYDIWWENLTIINTFNVSYFFANSSYFNDLKAFVLANSVNGTDTTSKLNVTALETQRATGERMSIFQPQSGRAIDAAALERWFVANPVSNGLNPSYWFYVINFTEFDSPDHALEHWYNTTEMDFEANRNRDFWRLEWDNTLNLDVKFPYACFTSQSRVFFIDPSAFQWYLTWARIWWELPVSGPKFDYYFEDLDEFLATHDVGTSQGKTDLAYYLAGWIDDALGNLLMPSIGYHISDTESISIQTLVLNNASDLGYTNEVMNWIINSTLVEEAITDLAPFLDVEVTIDFQYLLDYPELEAVFDSAVVLKEEGWTYYDGSSVWDGLSEVKESYFNFNAADVVVNGFVFLEKNMSMLWGGNEFTGLGGGGQILVMKELGRYFQEDGTTPKSGFGLVLIHEAGHNLGFPHTFGSGMGYSADFAFDVMGYYPYSFFFSQMRKDCFRRTVVDFKLKHLNDTLREDLALYESKPPNATIDTKFNEVYAAMDNSLQLYDELRYLEAYNKTVEAEELEAALRDLIWMHVRNWTTSYIGPNGYPIVDFATYNGNLWAASNRTIYRYNGSRWNTIEAPTYVLSLEAYQDKLVIGGEGGLYCYDGTNFTLVFSVSNYIKPLGIYNNTLYAGTALDKPPTLYCCNGSCENPDNWYIDTGFSDVLNFSGPFGSIDSFAEYNNKLYVTSGSTIFCYNGINWNITETYSDIYAFLDMEVYNGKLYLATRDSATRCPIYQGGSGFCGRVIEFDGDNWTTVLDHDYWVYCLETYGDKLYAGTANKIFTYNGTDWEISFHSEEGAYYAISMMTYDGKIYAGMGNGYILEDPSEAAGNQVIPEFPSLLILSLFMLATLPAGIAYRRKLKPKL